jgi:hypothetical protein
LLDACCDFHPKWPVFMARQGKNLSTLALNMFIEIKIKDIEKFS